MLLRVSGESSGENVNIHAVTEGDASSGVAHGDALAAFAEACVRGTEAELLASRDALEREAGAAVVAEAAAVVGNFERMTRIADGTGIPLDKPVAVFSADMRAELGIDGFGSAGETPEVPGWQRTIGRLAMPVLRVVMRGYSSK